MLYRSNILFNSIKVSRSLYAYSIRNMISTVSRMNVQQFATIIMDDAKRVNYQIIDVREPNELQIAQIAGKDVINLPLSRSDDWAPEVLNGNLLDAKKPTCILCHHGRRSMQMAMFLTHEASFSDVANIEGGIDSYSMLVDASIQRY